MEQVHFPCFVSLFQFMKNWDLKSFHTVFSPIFHLDEKVDSDMKKVFRVIYFIEIRVDLRLFLDH